VIIKATAIPLAYYPYSSTSRIVHWLTRHHGKISTLLKGALRPKSPFLGEYELFGTSELLYFAKRPHALHTAKECALLHPRPAFRTDWRAMQAASRLSALFNQTTPDEAPHPGLFEFFEELLDLAEEYGRFPPFIHWAELRFCAHHGHAPNLDNCTLCNAPGPFVFSAAAGGITCASCSKKAKLPILECPPDILAILRAWQKADHPQAAVKTVVSESQQHQLDAISGLFMQHHFDLDRNPRAAMQSEARSPQRSC
jgi:DNA repair protein RecO (recombination protein O)